MATFNENAIPVIKNRIEREGFPESKEKCPLREFTYVENQHSQKSSRKTWLCRARGGLFLKDWKCVGLNHCECIFKAAKEFN